MARIIRKRTVAAAIPDTLYSSLDRLAKTNCETISTYVRKILAEHVRHGGKPPADTEAIKMLSDTVNELSWVREAVAPGRCRDQVDEALAKARALLGRKS